MPDIRVLSPALLAARASSYQSSLRDYARVLRAECRQLVIRSRAQRAECRRLAVQSERAQAIPMPIPQPVMA